MAPPCTRDATPWTPCTSTEGSITCPYGQARPTTGHARSAHSEGRFVEARARLGHLGTDSPGVARNAADSAGVALPCPAPPRAAGLDQGDVGRVREQSEGEGLRAQARGAAAAGEG